MASNSVLAARNAGYAHPGSVHWACRHLDIQLEPGEIVALLGPNGAGKSTFLSLISGVRRPREGTIEILGQNPNHSKTRQALGVAPQDSAFPKTVRVCEVLTFVLAQYGKNLDPQLKPALNLGSIWGRALGSLSGGERRRVGLACALVARPPLIVLDEPTTGLDLESRYSFFAYVKSLVKVQRRGVLFSTHHFNEVEALADRVVVMNCGRKLREGSIAEIRSALGFKRVRFRCVADLQIPTVWGVTRNQANYEVVATDPEHFMRWLIAQPAEISDLEIQAASLEEIFVKLVAL